jgi:hypothetical protein
VEAVPDIVARIGREVDTELRPNLRVNADSSAGSKQSHF